MKKSLIALALVGAFAVPVFAQEAAPAGPHSVTGNLNLASDYIFRGISQSLGKPAIQGGLDYAHSSGFYAGTWASNVGWVDDIAKRGNSVEWDFFAGFKNELGPVSYDLGVLRYTYPGNTISGVATPDSTEVYVALGWEFLELKYSHAVSKNLFGWVNPTTGKNSRGSRYIELNASKDLEGGWGVSAHVGRQVIKNFSDASYTDWSVGVSKDVGFGSLGLTYSKTNADGKCGPAEPYCFGQQYDTLGNVSVKGKDASASRLVLSFSKEF